MEIVILRHGEAGKPVAGSVQDSARSLTVSGREEVEEVAESLRGLNMKFDLIAASPLNRSLETAKIVARHFKKEKSLELWDELKPEGDTKELYRRLSKLKPDACVMLVGHQPYLSSMIGELIGAGSARISLKKAGVARIDVSTLVPAARGELRWLLTPKLLKKVS